VKITIIGSGLVGSQTALLLLLSDITDKVYLYDKNYQKALGESMDINQCMSVLNNEKECITDPNIAIITKSDYIIITLGRRRVKGEIRTDLLKDNLPEIIEISRIIKEYSPNAVILMVTNPSDDLAIKCRDITESMVIPIGNELDTARLREIIHQKIRKPRQEIEAYVTGEHGENMVCHGVDNETSEIAKQIAINTIIKKGATVYAPAMTIVNTLRRLIE
jgi:L-lactate dehydrogenase